MSANPDRPARGGIPLDRLIPDSLRAEPGTLYRSRLFLVLFAAVLLLALCTLLGVSTLQSPTLKFALDWPAWLIYLALYAQTLIAFYRFRSLIWAVHALLACIFLAVFGVALALVLKYQMMTYLLLPLPVVAFILGGRWSGMVWTAIMALLQLVVTRLHGSGFDPGLDLGPVNPAIGHAWETAVQSVVITLVILCCLTYEIIVQRLQSALELEKSHFRHLASHDSLTGLPNRLALESHVRDQIARNDRQGSGFALVYLDFDNFKQVNDRFGHQVGDIVLSRLAERLRKSVREGDFVCRLGGDEFAIVIPGLTDPEVLADKVRMVQEELERPLAIGAESYLPVASYGHARYPLDAGNYAALVQRADSGMYAVKKQHKAQLA